MSDPSDAPTIEARIAGLFQQAEDTAVHQHGLSRAYVREALGGLRSRIYANEGGPLRILAPDDSGGFLPATRDDARAAALLAKEIAAVAPEEALMDLVAQHEEESARLRDEMARSGVYRL
jgi:hypothetical protein